MYGIYSLSLSLSVSLSLSRSQESRKFVDCQLGYFIVYADWANLTVKSVSDFLHFLTCCADTDTVCVQCLCAQITFMKSY